MLWSRQVMLQCCEDGHQGVHGLLRCRNVCCSWSCRTCRKQVSRRNVEAPASVSGLFRAHSEIVIVSGAGVPRNEGQLRSRTNPSCPMPRDGSTPPKTPCTRQIRLCDPRFGKFFNPFADAKHVRRQPQVTAFLEDWNQLVKVRPRMRAGDDHAYGMKQVFALRPRIALDFVDDGLEALGCELRRPGVG